MKVGVNARAFSVREPGGGVQAAGNLVGELADRSGVEVVLFGHATAGERVVGTDVVDTCYPRRSQVYGLVWERTILPALARVHDVDVLLCPNGNGPLHHPSVPVVLMVHDVNAQKGMSGFVHGLYRRACVPRAARLADVVVTVSEFSASEIAAVLGVQREGIRVVHNGVDETFLSGGGGEPADLPEQYLLYVGSLNPRKNVSRLVTAHERLREEGTGPGTLVLAGPGNKRVFEDLSVPPTAGVVQPGYLTVEELVAAYEGAAALVFPSLHEGFGLPPLEAMACGTPVVAADAGAIPEVVGDAAELVDPYSVGAIAAGIERVVTDADYRETLVDRGRRRVRRFTWERAADEMVSVLRSVSGQTTSL